MCPGIDNQNTNQHYCFSQAVERRIKNSTEQASTISIASQSAIQQVKEATKKHNKASSKKVSGANKDGSTDSYHDHRMAMSFALAGLRQPGVVIQDPACVTKTWPGYFAMLESL